MKSRWLLGLIALCATSLSAAGEPYPALNDRYFASGALDTSYTGKLIAIEGLITRIAPGALGKPLIKITLAGPLTQEVWIGSLVADDDSLLKNGHIIRALGYLSRADPKDTDFARVSSDQHLVLGFCILDISERKALFLPAGINDCDAWKNGTEAEELRGAL